jgi:hypothetical protein
VVVVVVVVVVDILVEAVLLAVTLVVLASEVSAAAAFAQLRTASAVRVSPAELFADRAAPCAITMEAAVCLARERTRWETEPVD